jgi:hypothetical protein
MSVDTLNVTEDIQPTTRNYGILLSIFTGIICILCIIFIITFNGDCHPSEYNSNMVTGIIQTISITSAIIFSIFGVPMAACSHFPNYLKAVNSKGFKPFWAILITLISITFLVSSIWLYRILKEDDFICGQDAKDVCPSGQTCKEGFCISNDNSCNNCPSGQTCVNSACQDADPCATIDDPKHNPPIYTDSHKTLFHCTAGLIVMSVIGLLEGFRLLYDWLHETTAEKIEKVKNIIKEFDSNPDAITQSKLKYIDDLLNTDMENIKTIPDGYKLIKDAQEARNKMRIQLKDQYNILKQAEEQATETKLAEEYIRMYSKASTIVEKRAVLAKLCQNHPSNRDALFKRLKDAGGDDPLLKQSIGTYCNTSKSALEDFKEKWNNANTTMSYDKKALDLEKLKIYKEMCSNSGAQEKSAFANFVASEDSDFLKRYEIGNCSLKKIQLIIDLNSHTFSTDKTTVANSLTLLQELCNTEEEIFTYDQKKNYLEYLSSVYPSFFKEYDINKYFCKLGGKDFVDFKQDLLDTKDEDLIKKLDKARPIWFSSSLDKDLANLRKQSISESLKKKGTIGESIPYIYKEKMLSDFVSPKSIELYEELKQDPSLLNRLDSKNPDHYTAIRLCEEYGCGIKPEDLRKALGPYISQRSQTKRELPIVDSSNTAATAASSNTAATAASSSAAATAASLSATASPFRAKKKNVTKRH